MSAEASGAGPSSGASASLPSTPLFSTSSSSSPSSKKHAWSSYSGGLRKRSTSAKMPPPSTSGTTPRVTRSTSARAASSGSRGIPVPLPRAPKKASSAGVTSGAEATPLPPVMSETVKEKEQVKLSPLHQALLDCVKTRPGEQVLRPPLCPIVKHMGHFTDCRTLSLISCIAYSLMCLSALSISLSLSPLVSEDPSMPVVRLIHALYILNTHWADLYPVSTCNKHFGDQCSSLHE